MEQISSHVNRARALNSQSGSCHCGAVRFTVKLEPSASASRCNCSVCTKINPLGALVNPGDFTLLTGRAELSSYAWGKKTGERFFCKQCGVHCFGRGHLAELGGDYVSVNLNCLDETELGELPVVHWDGRHDNWHAGPRPTPWPILSSGAQPLG